MTNIPPKQDYRALLQSALSTLEKMKARVDAAERAPHAPLAIIGMGCRFPGGARDLDSFWEVLVSGTDTITEVPPGRWDVDAYYDPDPDAPGKMYTRWGGFLENVDQFDPEFFGIAPREATWMDPQQRLLLEVTWEALANAGHAGSALAGSSTGVFLGIAANDYAQLKIKTGEMDDIDAYFGTGTSHSIASGRIAYLLGLMGPAVSVDTACSASLVAVHQACQSLRAKECDMAVAGGVNMMLSPDATISTSRARMMSFDGRCKTFDAAADGYVRAEGCAMIVLKRLADAIEAGDHIHAVIMGTALNQDGRSNGLTAPNGKAQEAVIQAALADAGLQPGDISYVETHGTGTTLGDPIEVRALGKVFGDTHSKDSPLMIGSVKTNVGHLEAAAGIAGLFKAVLALKHQTVPPHLHLRQLNPYIPWEMLPITVPTEPTPWRLPDGKRRIAGLSSFGFSGTNAHIILAEAPAFERTEPALERPSHVLVLSGRNESALQALAQDYATFLTERSPAVGDVCFTAATGRPHLSERLAITGTSTSELGQKLRDWLDQNASSGIHRGSLSAGDAPGIAFLFTGQGAQYVGMGRQLYDTLPIFRRALDKCDELLREHMEKSLLDVLFADASENPLINETAYTQPAMFAIEYALAQVWLSWGIQPTAVAGHSVGEYVAACLAGVFSLEDGLKLIASRGRLMNSLPEGGSMAAIFADEQRVSEALQAHGGQVAIATINAPGNIVISGAHSAVSEICSLMAEQGIKSRPLVVSHAFHSPLMDPILDDFERVASTVTYSAPQIDLVSNVSGEFVAPGNLMDAAYWREHIRAAVRFADTIQTLQRAGITVFVECGPQPTLLGMVRRAPTEDGAMVDVLVPSLRAEHDAWTTMLDGLATLYIRGVEVDWKAFDRDYERRRAPLPLYPFQRQRYWMNLPKGQRRARGSASGHALLGERLRSPKIDGVVFTNDISIHDPSFLDDHRVFGTPLLPATAFMEMALAAANHGFGSGHYAVESLFLQQAMTLPEQDTLTVQVALGTLKDGLADFDVYSLQNPDREEWVSHASGQIRRLADATTEQEAEALTRIKERCQSEVAAADYYQRLASIGADFGPAFRALSEVWYGDDEALARVTSPEANASDAGDYLLHPVLLDACIQLFGVAVAYGSDDSAEDGDVYIPLNIGAYELHRSGAHSLWCHATLRRDTADTASTLNGDLVLFDDVGQIVATLQGVQLRRVSHDDVRRASQGRRDDLYYVTQWEKVDAGIGALAGEPRSWLILNDDKGIGEELSRLLESQEQRCLIVKADAIDYLDPDGFVDLVSQVIGDAERPYGGTVHLWALDVQDEPGERDLAQSYASALHLAQTLVQQQVEGGGLWFVTHEAQAVVDGSVSATQAALWGLANTLNQEHPELNTVCIDIAAAGPDAASVVLAELAAADGEDRVGWRNGTRFVPRLSPLSDGTSSAISGDAPYELAIDERGTLDGLKVERSSRRAPGPGEVEIRTVASGLNFRDVLNALGMYPGPAGPLGNECAGVVMAVGQDVQTVRPGERVMALATRTFDRYVLAPHESVYRLPEGMTLQDAATIPLVFLTAYYGLHHLAHIKEGDKILIHAAAGGVGMAALQLAQLAGAEIFATASEPKWDALREMGVRHIFNSRTLDFADELLAATNGEGVDVVLNSLAGEFIPKSLAVLADHGCFLELGKRDIWTDEEVHQYNPTLAYHAYDLGAVLQQNPAMMKAMMDEMNPHFVSGRLKPLPRRTFPMARVEDAFRYMAQARHIGKIVVTHQDFRDAEDILSPQATYLITGGMGGLGLAIARGLADRGAKHIVLMGRSAPSREVQETLEEMRATGANVVAMQGDVSQRDDVVRVLRQIADELPALKGVIHAAGVLEDAQFLQQTWASFDRVRLPKIDGAWHLHTLTRQLPLDFFVMFSAGAALLGSVGQANYAAANAYMDGLAHERNAQGLPALSINWGAWAGAGMASALDERTQLQWQAAGIGLLGIEEGVQAFFDLLTASPAQVAVLPMDWVRMAQQDNPLVKWPFLSRVLNAHTPRRGVDASSSRRDLQQLLDKTPASERHSVLQDFVLQQVMRVLGLSRAQMPDVNEGLTDIGMDSLMAVELRNQLQTALEHRLPATLAFEYPTVAALTEFVAGEVLGLEAGAGDVEASETSDEEQLWREIEELDDDDIEDSLLQELEDAGY